VAVVNSETVIDAAPERVWDVVMNPACLADWVTIHRRLGAVSDGPPRAGFEMEQTLHLRGVNVRVHWELVECDAPRSALWEGHGPAHSRATIRYELRPDGGGTRFRYSNEFKAPLGLIGAAVSRALVAGVSEREAQRSLQRLKALVERR
jgi:carbon monoxide dehydrogenase subunit G